MDRVFRMFPPQPRRVRLIAPPEPSPEAEPIELPPTKVIPLALPGRAPVSRFGFHWEEHYARIVGRLARIGELPGPFTLWVIGQREALVITPRPLTPKVAEILALQPERPVLLPWWNGRPLLHQRRNGTLVRLWASLPEGLPPVQKVHYEWHSWRWENRSYCLVDG